MADDESSNSDNNSSGCESKRKVCDKMDAGRNENVNPLYLATSQSEHSSLSHPKTQKTHRPQHSDESSRVMHTAAAPPTDDGARFPADVTGKSVVPNSGSLPLIAAVSSRSHSAASDDGQQLPVDPPVPGQSPLPVPPMATVKPITIGVPPQPPARLIRKQSTAKPDINCPRINCPEKIVICLDVSKEMENKSFVLRQGDKKTPLELVRRALNIFLQTKSAIDSRHEFALMLLENTAKWMCDFTNSPGRILTNLEAVNSLDVNVVETCDLSTVFNEVANHVRPPDLYNEPPPYCVRIILIYGRSLCEPMLVPNKVIETLYGSKYFCIDVFYIHDVPSSENQCETIFSQLCKLDTNGNSYIVEASKNPTKIFDCMAQLLAHPLQRPLQENVSYAIPMLPSDG